MFTIIRTQTIVENLQNCRLINILYKNDEYTLFIKPHEFMYDSIVSKLITLRYTNDSMQAIINNYLLDKEEKHIAEFNKMQEYRKECKEFAKTILSM
jgi:hypothetical protein